MIFAIALFDDAGVFRGVAISSHPDPATRILNGKPLHAVDLGCFDYPNAAAAHASILHAAFDAHPASSIDAPRVAIKPDAVDVARRDLNTPATLDGLKARLRAHGPAGINRSIGEAISLQMGDDARALGLPRPHPADRERLRSLFSSVEDVQRPLSIRQIAPARKVRAALARRDRALADNAAAASAWSELQAAAAALPEPLPEPLPDPLPDPLPEES